MKRKHGALDRAADTFMRAGGTPYGDERERAVAMEASTFGFSVGIYANLAVALVAALLGGLLLPAMVLLLMALPSWSAMWYAGRRQVDMSELAERVDRRTKAVVGAIVFWGMLLTFAAMAHTVFVGHGLVPIPDVDVTGAEASGFVGGLVQGGVVGGILGMLIGAVAMTVEARRPPKPRPEPVPDEE